MMKGFLSTVFVLAIFGSPVCADDYVDSIMRGISNHGRNGMKPYVTAGDRIYLIGTQDGNFPDMGSHVEGEMGGLWLHPIKLIDGFWVKVSDVSTRKETFLSGASEFINYPFGNRIRYSAALNNIDIERFQFCPDGLEGMVIEYTISNKRNTKAQLNFEFLVKTNLSPVWLSDQLGIKDRSDEALWDANNEYFVAYDNGNSWYAVWGSSSKSSRYRSGADLSSEGYKVQTAGNGTFASAEYDVTVDPNSNTTLMFVIAGSARDKSETITTYSDLMKNYNALLEKKKHHYASIIKRARIKIPDRLLQDVYHWVKINTEWLVREVPEIGRGLGAGLMEYPWWFGCDNTYSLQAVMATGDFELAKQTLRLLKNESMKKNGNGRIIHEVSTNGVVYNPGNTQETAHFIMCVEKLFRWTGDLKFIQEMYPVMKMGIQWLLNDMDQNRNLFPEGYGIMEVYGLNAELIDVAVYTQQALTATAYVAGILNDQETQKEYTQLATKLKEKINRDFWDETEGSYTDFFGTRAQAISAAEGAITQIKKYGDEEEKQANQRRIAYYEELKRKFVKMPDASKGWITNKNWVINTPMETGIAPEEKAVALLDKIRKENTGEYGPYLSAVEKNAMMTISTGVQAVAEAQYERIDESMWYVNKIAQTFGRVLPGSISEMMPDYGQFTQAWTSYGVFVPLVQHVFGIQPDAYAKTIVIEPQLPSGWKNISIENLPVGSNIISFTLSSSNKEIQHVLTGSEEGWTFVLKLKDSPGAKYFLNGKSIDYAPSGFHLLSRRNELTVSK